MRRVGRASAPFSPGLSPARLGQRTRQPIGSESSGYGTYGLNRTSVAPNASYGVDDEHHSVAEFIVFLIMATMVTIFWVVFWTVATAAILIALHYLLAYRLTVWLFKSSDNAPVQ
jgi:hypothetical protein